MSQRQEELKERLWESHHKEGFDKDVEDLRTYKTKVVDPAAGTPEHANLLKEYESRKQALEDFFMKFHP